MPLSKRRRRKNGKKVGKGESKNLAAHNKRLASMESGVSLQDLINVMAYQEGVKDGSIVDDGTLTTFSGDIPVFLGEGEDRKQIGTADNVPGEDKVSIHITDPEAAKTIAGPIGDYSIDKEHQDGQ